MAGCRKTHNNSNCTQQGVLGEDVLKRSELKLPISTRSTAMKVKHEATVLV